MELSPENKLILAASTLRSQEADNFKIHSLIKSVSDWEYFVNNSIRNGVAPILYWNFSSLAKDKQLLPGFVFAKLEQAYFMSLRRNMVLCEYFRKVVDIIAGKGFPVIALKGISLAQSVYPDIALRQMSDIDLLLKEQDAQSCWEILLGAGLRFRETSKTQFIKVHTENKHLPSLEMGGVYIELHTCTYFKSKGYTIDMNEYWDRSLPLSVAHESARTLCPEHQLQHTCMHLDEHYGVGRPQLHSFTDIACVVDKFKDSMDWDYLLESSHSYRCDQVVFQYLQLAEKYLRIQLPEKVSQKNNEFKSDDAERLFLHYLQNSDTRLPNDITNAGYEKLQNIPGVRNKIRYLLNDIFPSKAFMIRRYKIRKRNLFIFYYVPRIGTGTKRLITQLFKEIARSGKNKD